MPRTGKAGYPNRADARGDNLNIPQDELMRGIVAYPDPEQDLYLWMFGYAREVLHGSRREMCDWCGYDWTTIARIAHGRYGDEAQRANFRERIEDLRREAAALRGTEFVETIVTRKIFAALDLARDQHAVVHITGASGRSKTHACREWQRRNNHGRAIYIDVPVIGGVTALMQELATRGQIASSGRRNMNRLAQRLLGAWGRRHTIIVDEAVRLLPSTTSSRSVRALEFLRRLHDVSGVGLVLVSTRVFASEMAHGTIATYLEQLGGRIEEPLTIPDRVSRTEARQICAGFTAEPSAGLVAAATAGAKRRGRGRVLFSVLRQAAALAEAKGEPLGEAHLQAAVAYRRNMHRWPED